MATEQMFTELPTVGSAQLTDIICAVQGYTASPLNLGLSVQETLGQVYLLFQSNLILSYPGDPNGNLAGTTYQLCWDTVDLVLWVCTTSGTASTAVWTESFSSQSNWALASTTPFTLVPNFKYVANNGATLSTFTLPATAAFGSEIEIAGASSGGWTITQQAGQSINNGNLITTVGVGGSLSSTNQNDYVRLVCIVADTTWNVISSIGMLDTL
jgi:hypothetical protein